MEFEGGDAKNSDSTSALARLRAAAIPALRAQDWTPSEAKVGLCELARLRAQLAVAQALLVRVMAKETGRDTSAAISRHTGMSSREAREATKVAEVVEAVVGAEEALANGSVSANHLAALSPLVGTADAAALLEVAAGQSPEEFARTVQRVRIERAGPSWSEKQRAARSARFFNEEYGCIGMRAVLPPVAGAELKAVLTRIADDAWRIEHPQRAEMLGGHGGEPYERRLADALVALVRSHGGSGPDATPSESGLGAESSVTGSVRESASAPASSAESVPVPESGPGTSGESVPRSTATGSPSVRPTVVVTINAETLDADIVGQGPIPFADAVELAARADLYAMIRHSRWGILKFGRNRRLASPLQRLAVIVRDRQCVADGCTADHTRCDVHHEPPFEDGGLTDIDHLELVCTNEHHPHRHSTGVPLAGRVRAAPPPAEPTTSVPAGAMMSDEDVNSAFADLVRAVVLERMPGSSVWLAGRNP